MVRSGGVVAVVLCGLLAGQAAVAQTFDAVREDIYAFLKPRLAKMKTPRSIDFIEEMPRDPNGKLYKRKLRDPYWEGRERAI